MEVNVKDEQAKASAEITQINAQMSQVNNQLAIFEQRRQALVNILLRKTGELELLQRLDGGKKVKKEK